MPDLETAETLLAAAKRDLHALGNMHDPDAFPVEVFGFHAQQAVEKSLKAWLCVVGVSYARTHSLRYLLALLEREGEEVSVWRMFEDLSMFAVQFRYDSYVDLHEALDRHSLFEKSRELWNHVDELFRAAESQE